MQDDSRKSDCIYLDNAATTRPLDAVIDQCASVMRDFYGNPSSLHGKGAEAERIVSQTRKTLAKIFGVNDRTLSFMSGGTEANNYVLQGTIQQLRKRGGRIITTHADHASVVQPLLAVQSPEITVDYIDVDRYGQIDLDMLESTIQEDTVLIALTHVNNETGIIQPVEAISKIRNRKNEDCILFVDSIQSFCKLGTTPEKSGVDILTVSAHKIHGPKGIAAVYQSDRVKLKPLLLGGGQEKGRRSGTENVPSISGFGLAAEKMSSDRQSNAVKVNRLKQALLDGLNCSGLDLRVLSKEDNTSPYILSVSFRGVKAEVLLHHLSRENIYISTGSACSSRSSLASHVLQAMQLEPEWLEGAVRFSFSPFNTIAEINRTLQVITETVPEIYHN